MSDFVAGRVSKARKRVGDITLALRAAIDRQEFSIDDDQVSQMVERADVFQLTELLFEAEMRVLLVDSAYIATIMDSKKEIVELLDEAIVLAAQYQRYTYEDGQNKQDVRRADIEVLRNVQGILEQQVAEYEAGSGVIYAA